MYFRNHVLNKLNTLELDIFFPDLTEITLSAGQVLYSRGDSVEDVYFPSNCVLSIAVPMADGSSVEGATIGRESVVGVLAALSDAPTHSHVFTQVPGVAMKLPAASLKHHVCDSPPILGLMLGFVQQNVSQSEQSVGCLAVHTMAQRLARWLLVTEDRVDADIFPLTQDGLATKTGVQRTTVSAVAADLKERGWIDYRRGRVQILDRPALERVSCECYEACPTMTPM